jgi:hypothetical protein
VPVQIDGPTTAVGSPVLLLRLWRILCRPSTHITLRSGLDSIFIDVSPLKEQKRGGGESNPGYCPRPTMNLTANTLKIMFDMMRLQARPPRSAQKAGWRQRGPSPRPASGTSWLKRQNALVLPSRPVELPVQRLFIPTAFSVNGFF